MTNPALPKIIAFTGTHDGGPCDDGPTAVCPHCGADGRYVHFFITEDGVERGAMSGCIELFPVSPVAKIQRKLRDKERELQRKYGKDAHLNSWQTKMLDSIRIYQEGGMDEATCLSQIRYQEQKMAEYRASKGKKW